jgi:hypothetical protein
MTLLLLNDGLRIVQVLKILKWPLAPQKVPLHCYTMFIDNKLMLRFK